MRKLSLAKIIIFLTLFLNPLLVTATAPADIYSTYNDLDRNQDKGEDYRITSFNGPSATAVIAIHGGYIEIGTCQLAKSVARLSSSDYYTFEGIKSSNNRLLHITSTNFDEPIAIKLIAASEKILSIHGCTGKSKITYVGGLDKHLADRVKDELNYAGFKAAAPSNNLSGISRYNICNLNANRKGVQLELTYALRHALLKDQSLYGSYVKALSKAL